VCAHHPSPLPKMVHTLSMSGSQGIVSLYHIDGKRLFFTPSQDILDAARMIPEKVLSLREDSKRRLAAYVGDTTVDIDLEQHTIIHRCPTWTKSIPEKKLCSHVARLFLMVDPNLFSR
jgi:hypothetical protein